ncbi:uroporphyrinogen III synthase [Wigglesworthia glossinidia endosymbiont of Glossina morsitans morsitans (Yale colony)]|uniref:Uroporphyrinogen-III synthase n=1 Tax=Wigglesworthia glossinidia endosymbiont of Glossina morsitans morsitans (Yale colony) TaxID=1142511 RepID=H6Q576_WIGGL|nr:uroporphyrinogen-III synthase [Wigglesworthia glossinidia]AFA41359.1 uroporphyrinogen III synthase [Wigglesworthia glossinidia endosymbiont of Glossina morsitans morsitans (Yale colony)]
MNILITRPYPDGKYLVKMLRAYGEKAWYLPLIYFTPGKDLIILQKLLASLFYKDLICIVSPRAVYYANSQIILEKLNWPKYVRYYAIGHTSAQYFTKISGIKANYSKYGNTSENLIELLSQFNLKKKNVLILKGNNGRKKLKVCLKLYKANIISCECYYRNFIQYEQNQILKIIKYFQINTLVVTSCTILIRIHGLIPIHYRTLFIIQCKLVVVSHRIYSTAYHLGWRNIILSSSSKNQNLLQTLLSIK